MNELPSTQFRKTFARLSEPTIVTANGHVIGLWTPVGPPDLIDLKPQAVFRAADTLASLPGGDLQARQKLVDELLGRINRR